MSVLSENIRRAREKNGYSLKEAAEKTGIGWRTLSDYENGRSRPDVEKLATLCVIYHISADELIDIKQKKSPDVVEEPPTEDEIIQAMKDLQTIFVHTGIIKPGEDLSESDFRFFHALIQLAQAHFSGD